MRRYYSAVVVLSFLALILTACSSAAAAPTQKRVDPAGLPPEVDAGTVRSLQGRDDVVILDVREQWEYDSGHIPGVKLIPMQSVSARLSEIPRDKTVIVTCRSGNRSGQVADYLRQQGYTDVHNMLGGIMAWQAAGYPVEK